MFAGIGALSDRPWPGRCLVLVSPSHGENRGSSPLGSANEIKHFRNLSTSDKFSDLKLTYKRAGRCLCTRVHDQRVTQIGDVIGGIGFARVEIKLDNLIRLSICVCARSPAFMRARECLKFESLGDSTIRR